jgi:hypothetical protein
MDKTLVIYDSTGALVSSMTGNYVVPQGELFYLEVIVPAGKLIASIDVSKEVHAPIYTDLPVPETVILQERITMLEGVVNSIIGF